MSALAWGTTPTGEEVTRVELGSQHLRLGVLTWGATVQSLTAPDTAGTWADVVLGFDTLEPYVGTQPFIGATVGRYANRIADASFELDGVRHHVPANDGRHALHGGPDGFWRRNWELVAHDEVSATLRLVSPAGDMGFPGRLEATTVFRVDGSVVTQEITVTTDAPTIVNLTNHAYFNLTGTTAPVDDHMLELSAETYLPVDETGIPLPGRPASVADTAFDFRESRVIGRASYDHTFVLDGPITLSAGGRSLTLTTSEPGVQLYTGDHLDGGLDGRAGALRPRSGVCLETQHYPDSPNRPDYPSTVLRPGQTYVTRTDWEVRPTGRE
jgi:aldose 1-epimerase